MGELASAPAFLLIGNDATEQNPLVAWQIRSAIRHVAARLYVVDSREIEVAAQSEPFRAGCFRRGRCRDRGLNGRGSAVRRFARIAKSSSGGRRPDRAVRRRNTGPGARRSGGAGRAARAGRPTYPVHGARRLCEFARRRGHGFAAGSAARLCRRCGHVGARKVWKIVGRFTAGKTGTGGRRDDRWSGGRHDQRALRCGRESA